MAAAQVLVRDRSETVHVLLAEMVAAASDAAVVDLAQPSGDLSSSLEWASFLAQASVDVLGDKSQLDDFVVALQECTGMLARYVSLHLTANQDGFEAEVEVGHALANELLEDGQWKSSQLVKYSSVVSGIASARERVRKQGKDRGRHLEIVARAAAVVCGLLAIREYVHSEPAEAPERSDEAVQVRPMEFVESLDDPLRLSVVRTAIETMLSELEKVRSEGDLTPPDAEEAEVLSEALLRLYRMEAPPPVASVDGNLSDAARLLRRNEHVAVDDEVAGAADELLADRSAGDIHGVEEPLQHVLQSASRRARAEGVRELTLKGMREGYTKLVSSVVVGSPLAALEAIGWLTDQRSWLAAFVQFLVAAGRARV